MFLYREAKVQLICIDNKTKDSFILTALSSLHVKNLNNPNHHLTLKMKYDLNAKIMQFLSMSSFIVF